MKMKWLRICRKPAIRIAGRSRQQTGQTCNYSDNYYGDQVCGIDVKR